MAMRAEPGWRVVIRKVVDRPPEPQDMPGELLYKLIVMPVRFWGFTYPRFNPELRKPPPSPVPRPSEGWLMQSGQATKDDVLMRTPIPLGKGKKPYQNIVEVLEPDETDRDALLRIEAHYEAERNIQRLSAVYNVMES
jgi:hypothetical protein